MNFHFDKIQIVARPLCLLPLAMIGAAAGLAADVTFEETFLSAFDRTDLLPPLFNYPDPGNSPFDNPNYEAAPFDPNRAATFRVYIKGAKLARVGLLSAVIYDLDSGSVTNIDKNKRTFTVLTFAQMQRQIDKGPRCGNDCQLFVEDTGRTADINGVEANEYRISAAVGQGESAIFLAHATYWTVPRLASAALSNFAKVCNDKFAPQYADVCALTLSNGFGIVSEAEKELHGYVVARIVETRSRAASLPRGDAQHEPWDVQTGPTVAQVRRTETRMANVTEGPVSDSVFAIPRGYLETKHHRW